MVQVSIELVGFPEARRDEVVRRLARISRRDEAAIRQLLEQGGGRCRIAEATDRGVAQQVRSYLEPLGVELEVAPVAASTPGPDAPSSPPAGDLPQTPAPPPPQEPPAAGGGEAPRPLGFGQRLRWGLELCGRNFWSLVGLLLLMVAAGLIFPLTMVVVGGAQMQGLAGGAMAPADPMAMLATMFSPATVAAFFLSILAVLLVFFWIQAALYRLPADSLVTGERTRVFRTLGSVFGRTPDFITALGLVFLIQLPIQAAAGVGALVAAPYGAAVAVQLAALVAIVWLTLSLMLVSPVVVFEEVGPVAALRRGWSLVSGMRWRLLGNFLLLGLVAVGVLLLAVWLVGMAQGAGGAVAGVAGILMALFVLVLELVFLFLILFFVESFYFEARVRKEGWRPGWLEPLDPSWAVSEAPEEAPGGRGLRAWLELAGFTILAVALLYAVTPYLPHQMGNGPPAGFRPGAAPMEPSPAPSPKASPDSRSQPPVAGETGMRLSLGTFFQGDSPHVWLEASVSDLDGLPEGVGIGGLLTVEIDRVEGPEGDLYARDSQLEQPFFHRVRLEREPDGTLTGRRDVHLVGGAREGDLRAVRGTARLAVPRGVSGLRLGSGDAGAPRTVHGIRVRLEELSEREAKLRLEGDRVAERFVGFTGVTAAGRRAPTSTSRSAGGGGLYLWGSFPQPLQAVRVFIARDVAEREADFEVRPGRAETLELGG